MVGGVNVQVLSRQALRANKRACGRPKDIADLALLDEYDAQVRIEGGHDPMG